MTVGGDYFYSRGIVQVNILVDNDDVDIAVAEDLSPIVKTAGNEVHNIAEFITHESTISVRGAAGTPHWAVSYTHLDVYKRQSWLFIATDCLRWNKNHKRHPSLVSNLTGLLN